LGVATILEGGVQRSGKQVRINVQLIDTKTGGHLWAEIYDRELTVENLFQIQSEITREIVAALNAVLSPDDRNRLAVRPTENLDAYELYLKGRYFWQRRGEDNIRHAIDLFAKATELDPKFARAWSSLAAAHVTLTAWSDASEAEQYPLAVFAAKKALMLDDSLAEAYAVLGDMARVDRKWTEAKAYYLRAIASEPKNSTAHLWYGEHLNSVGHTRDALEETLIAYRLDPLHPGTNTNLAGTYLQLGDTSNALKYGAASWDLGASRGLWVQAQAYQRLGKFERAMEFTEQWAEQDSDSALSDAFRLFIEAKIDAAKTPLYFEFLAENESVLPPDYVLWDYAAFDRIDDAYRLLKRAPDSIDGVSWVFYWSPYLTAFRQDPRFAELVTEHGLVDYWREHGWPDACKPAGDSVNCE
jgi:tetratricopeptide (TPR) repeat protein